MRRLLLFFFPLFLAAEGPSVLFRGRDSGMFSVFNDVLALVKIYDRGDYRGIRVDFGSKGLYYDARRGENWWGYYCEPVDYGLVSDPEEVFGDVPFSKRREAEWYTKREEARALISKYIRFKPHILEEARAFEEENFEGCYMIGVHYRGTDKMKEEASVYYPHELYRFVMDKVRQLKRKDYRIFLATDDAGVVNLFASAFSGRVCYLEGASRSSSRGKPPHLLPHPDRYELGKEAILDCLLLSRCDLLVRTSSNLSLWSTFLNPALPVIELNERIDDEKPKDE